MLVLHSTLATFIEEVLEANGVGHSDAQLVADTLVKAELWGHHSHGALRLPWYVSRLQTGAIKANETATVERDTGPLAVLDGRHGIGQVLMAQGADLAVERAKQFGIGGVGIRNSNHFGAAGYFSRRMADSACVALILSNSSPAMPPWGGSRKALGSNPWTIAAPAGRYGQVMMDISNTAVARGKIYLANERGEAIPDSWATDSDGVPTTDAEKALQGLILPMAGHKGYIISFMIDVIAGVLTGSAFGSSVIGPYEPNGVSGAGHFALAINIESMIPLDEFTARMEDLIDEMKSVPPIDSNRAIYYPGEVEDISERKLRATGIDLPSKTHEDLKSLGQEVGVSFL